MGWSETFSLSEKVGVVWTMYVENGIAIRMACGEKEFTAAPGSRHDHRFYDSSPMSHQSHNKSVPEPLCFAEMNNWVYKVTHCVLVLCLWCKVLVSFRLVIAGNSFFSKVSHITSL